MSFFPNSRTFLQIGPLHIQWYAVLILSGACLAYWLSKQNARKLHYPDTVMSDYFIYMLWCGVIGARLWYCIFYDPQYYFSNPLRILQIYEGGLAIHGGLLAGILYSIFYCKRKGLSFLQFADCIMPNVLLAQAIGRWGNFVNQECHGQEVAESFYDGPLFFLKEGMHINGHYYEPMFFYESMANLLGFFLIGVILRKHRNKRGDLTWAYLMWYGIVRFFIESRRTDALQFGPFKVAQLASVAAFLIGLLGYLGVFERFFPKRKPTVLFDFDGTLVDTEQLILDSYLNLFRARGREAEFTREKQLSVLGPALNVKMKDFFPEEDPEALIREYSEGQQKILSEVTVMPQAAEMLKELQEEGYTTGVVSARYTESVERIAKQCGLYEYLGGILGRDEYQKDKPDPDGIITFLDRYKANRDEVIYVGDSPSDIASGKAYGAYTIAYCRGDDRSEAVKAASPDAVVSSLSEIPELVRSCKA